MTVLQNRNLVPFVINTYNSPNQFNICNYSTLRGAIFITIFKEEPTMSSTIAFIISMAALARFLSKHSTRQLGFCLDNDYDAKNKGGFPAPNHGQVAAKQFCHDYGKEGYETSVLVPELKDWNEVQKKKAQLHCSFYNYFSV
jgi:hypothetical protein